MPYTKMKSWLEDELQGIRDGGLFKEEKLINTPQGSEVDTPEGRASISAPIIIWGWRTIPRC